MRQNTGGQNHNNTTYHNTTRRTTNYLQQEKNVYSICQNLTRLQLSNELNEKWRIIIAKFSKFSE